MPSIQINIKDKVARADRAIIVCDNSDYTAVFDFDAEWDEYTTKTARFVYGSKYTDVVFSGNECPVPVIQDTRAVTVGVFAGDLHTTTPAYFACVPSILFGGGVPADPTPDVYNQIMELLNNISLGGNPATTETLGLIKVGENLTITEDGVLSADQTTANNALDKASAAQAAADTAKADAATAQSTATDAQAAASAAQTAANTARDNAATAQTAADAAQATADTAKVNAAVAQTAANAAQATADTAQTAAADAQAAANTAQSTADNALLIANTQPDWNQNDSTQPDYVKNRPFYTGDPVETVLVEESTVPFAAEDGAYMGQLESTFSATVGETYKVYWDGAAYECACVNFNDRPFIGNLSFIGAGSDTGEPFIMMVNNGDGIAIRTANTSASHTFSISGFAESIVKIPAKYIDKNSSGYVVIHSKDTMTQLEAENYITAISTKEVVFIIWNEMCISGISFGGTTGYDLQLTTQNREDYHITENNDGVFAFSDRTLDRAIFPNSAAFGDNHTGINVHNNKVIISKISTSPVVGSTDVLFQVRPDGEKSKSFEVLGNGEAVAPALILYSSTPNSTKKFRITVDDSGAITATEVT